jgi:hypothetical protein
MKYSANKWLAYTFLVGAIPLLTRALVWTITVQGRVAPLTVADIVAFGLVLHVSIFNELELIPNYEREWKAVMSAFSMVCVAHYGSLYAVALIGERTEALVDQPRLLACSIMFLMISIFLCNEVLKRLRKVAKR